MENHQWYTNKAEVKIVEEGRIIISDAILGNTGRKVKILEVSNNHVEEVQRQKQCFETSLNLSSELFLQGLHYDKDLASVWADDWSTFKLYLKQFLRALARLYEEENMYHGHLRHYNLVISGDRALVSGVEGNLLPDGFEDEIFTDETKELGRVLLPSQNLGKSPMEIDLCESWNMIFCHPIFLDFQHKLYYFLIANQYLNEHLKGSTLAKDMSRKIERHLLTYGIHQLNWHDGVNLVNDPVMMQSLNSRNYGTVPHEFLRFVRNCIAHLNMEANVEMCQQAEILARKIEESYPGFLFALHAYKCNAAKEAVGAEDTPLGGWSVRLHSVAQGILNVPGLSLGVGPKGGLEHGDAAVTVCPLSSVSSLVRFAEEPQMFAVEFSDGCPIHVYASNDAIQTEGQCAILVLPRLTMPGHRIDPPCGSVYLQYGQQKSVADAESASMHLKHLTAARMLLLKVVPFLDQELNYGEE
ncbi:hypothetical protein Ahy_B08g092245 isoform B [Arachis hypogaea]|nr:hypothetical protein Ahy_B08g092245 isoform B [Arachis hypogaea]